MFKKILAIIVNILFYSLYIKKGSNYDYPVIVIACVFVSYLFYIFGINKDRKLVFFVNSSNILFLFIGLIFFGFKYLNFNEVKVLTYNWLFFILCFVINEIINNFFANKLNKNFILRNFFFLIVYPFLVAFIVYKSYANLFIFLSFYMGYLILFFIFQQKIFFEEKYYLFLYFFLIILLFSITRVFYIFIIGMNYEKFSIFILLFFLPFLYYIVVENEYNEFFNIDSNKFLIEKLEPQVTYFKNLFLLIVLVFGFGFKNTYNYIKVYYGYQDYFNFFSIIISIFLFYFFENYIDFMVKKIENLALNIIFNVSVIIFLFAASIVISSYIFSLNFINLVSIFFIYSLLAFIFSRKYLSHIVSVIYLGLVYLIIYV